MIGRGGIHSRRTRALTLAGGLAGLCAGACANPSASLVILQNQVPEVDTVTGACFGPVDLTAGNLGSGVFDVALDRARPYLLYPLIQSRLPSVVSGGVERNGLSLRHVHVQIKAPPGIDPAWEAGCPGTFDWPEAASLDPTQLRTVVVPGFQSCHAQRLHDLIEQRVIPADLSQPVFFTLELTVVADRSGGNVSSDPFPFGVQVCAGCLQSMFPATPLCAAAPKPNPLRGNPCNFAQDGPDVLCCFDDKMLLICPAPDM